MSSAETPTGNGPGRVVDGLLTALTTTLLVICVAMVGWGAIAPTSEEEKPTRGLPEAVPAAVPVRLDVDAFGIDASVVPIQLSPDAVLDPPADPKLVGWWDGSAKPGAARGQVVITGHTVQTGGGALDSLGKAQGVGQRINLRTRAGVQRYRVVERIVASRQEVAEDAEALFGQDRTDPRGARLVLVTCTDWNGRFYESNIILVARPMRTA